MNRIALLESEKHRINKRTILAKQKADMILRNKAMNEEKMLERIRKANEEA